MSRRESSFEIESAAVRWAARADRGPFSPKDQADLEVWLASDDRRIGAYARARALALYTERAHALGAGYDPRNFETAKVSRRGLWVGGATLGLAAAAAGVAIVPLLAPSLFYRRFHTRIGEVRLIALQDGSTVTLNTASGVAIHFTEESRNIRLLRGEALFDVAKDPGRPFVVATETATVRAVGTSFTVRQLNKSVEVLVREGTVELERVAAASSRPEKISANTRAKISANTRAVMDETTRIRTETVRPSEMEREMVWRSGMIAFEGMTLAEAAEQFARYSETRIIIDDPEIASKTVTGLYSASDPAGFARAIASAFDLQADMTGDGVHIKKQGSSAGG